MAEQDIRARHESLESLTSTQSVKALTEIRTQAHKDRGELLELLSQAEERYEAEKRVNDELQAFIEEFVPDEPSE